MVKVKVEYLGYIKSLLKKRFEELELEEGAPLAELLTMLSERHGEPFKREVYEPGYEDLKEGFMAMLNGTLIGRLQGLRTPLKDGDHLILMTLVDGG